MSPDSYTLADARRWCRDFTSAHDENFVVASRWLLRDEIRDAYFALYAFARGADDRADVSGSLAALDRWQHQLDALYAGRPLDHMTFIALRSVVEGARIEKDLFDRMLEAFRQDQDVHRYGTWDDLRRYTTGSADPVGRWVLRVHGYHSPALDRYSDAICTGLQLVNFMQDVREDLELRDRIYLPQDEMRRFGVTAAMLQTSPAAAELRLLLQFQAERAERLFAAGRPLLEQVDPALRRQLILFHGGGRLALHALRRARYDVTSHHVGAGRVGRLALLIRALRGRPL